MNGFPLANVAAPQEVEASKQKEPMVPMLFPGPADVHLVLQNNTKLIFKPGVQMVPVSLTEHPWLKAHKVTLVVAGQPTVTEAVIPAETKTEAKTEVPPQPTTAQQTSLPVDAAQGRAVLTTLTKADLATYARQRGLDLDPEKMKKDEMVDAILEAQQKVAKGA